MAVGKHLIFDVWVGADTASLLDFLHPWPGLLTTAALRSGATVIGQQFYQFEPRGVTGFVLLAESHISVHTFPEEKLATLDIFTCGNMDEELAMAHLRRKLLPVREKVTVVLRGD